MLRVNSLLALWSITALTGGVLGQTDCPATGTPIIAHSGDPVGKEQLYNDSMYHGMGGN